MKVPFSANTAQTTPKPLTPTTNATFPAISAATYEPKSVLDLRRSPSPAHEKPIPHVTANISVPPRTSNDDTIDPLADHVLINDWDSLMRELGLNDDSTPLSSSNSDAQLAPTHFDSTHFGPPDQFGLLSDIPTAHPILLPPNPNSIITNSFDVDFDYVDELIRLAECLDTKSVQLGHVILARLNRRLASPSGKPLQRAAFYYKEALQSLLTDSAPATHRPASSSEIVQTIKAQKTFSSVSPIPLFSSFTANQAVLEALDGGSAGVHVIDFDIGLGGHWASFMKELADREDGFSPAPALRISALVSEEYANESRLIRESLTQLARELSIRFEIDFVFIRTFEYLSFKAIRFAEGEKVAVILSPAIFRRVRTAFLGDLRRISPHVVVHACVEGHMDSGAASNRQAAIDGLEFYSTLLESLEAANFNGGGSDWMRRIETFVVFPKIVEAAVRRGTWWREAMVAAGLRQVGLSQFAEFQAECLLRRVQVRGFHVARRQAELVLCWHDRPIVATSAWRY